MTTNTATRFVCRYTTAPVDYDGFGTVDHGVVGTTCGKDVRRVSISEDHLYWQSARYGSGMHACRDQQEWDEILSLKLGKPVPLGYLVPVSHGTSVHVDCDPEFASEQVRQQFWCANCAEPCDKSLDADRRLVPVYDSNIGIYSQVCDCCGKLVRDGVKRAADGGPLCLFGLTA